MGRLILEHAAHTHKPSDQLQSRRNFQRTTCIFADAANNSAGQTRQSGWSLFECFDKPGKGDRLMETATNDRKDEIADQASLWMYTARAVSGKTNLLHRVKQGPLSPEICRNVFFGLRMHLSRHNCNCQGIIVSKRAILSIVTAFLSCKCWTAYMPRTVASKQCSNPTGLSQALECRVVRVSTAFGGVEQTPLAISAVCNLGIRCTRLQTWTGCTARTCGQDASQKLLATAGS